MDKIIAKSILNKNSINLYDEYNHNSIYENSVVEVIRSYDDQLEKVKKDLSKKKNRNMVHLGLTYNLYPEIEEELEVTKRLLDIVYDYAYGVTIFTKSNMILRDLETIDEINKQKRAVVMMPITTVSDTLSKSIDPKSASTKERLNILSECSKRGIETVVWITPILPYINDSVDNIKGILEQCKKVGVKAIITFGLSLKLEDNSREYFFKNINKLFPNVKDKYIEQFSEENSISTPKNITLENIIFKFCLDNNIKYGTENVFEYLNDFPERTNLFDFEF